ncbi:GntR family transcriptional regulator [Conexibacter sp. JD483]|uniref:GntR family transcriptional regulator n=1 Tax=unclassified Conexibacter TaxID=2627773 RepID=UPI002725D760|nr:MULTISPECIES: GntR family transcriptional regulator [unclassified Conexibacter]MDO8188491.1 GntR family transcriptional regulator [Conexibacter sp. CPCC 205706]MDO8201433.1 GntR family transcriptional regulator [Conexibacter sp. CPCC 205762]MDR9372884.1 GntR family transcriptional regulator [Conexibacter sp. JD483]
MTATTREQEPQALVDDLAERIRQRIMTGEIPIGAQLRQAALASEFGVSRTPVREALRQLQTGGLITVVPNRGAVVRVPSPWEVRSAHEVRAELEGLAAERAATRITEPQLAILRRANETMRRAAEKARPRQAAAGATAPTTLANDEIHTTIHEAARNPWLGRMINQINESFPRNVLALVLASDPAARRLTVVEHDQIIGALEAGDGPAARAAMHKHVIESGEQLARWYEERSTTVFQA